MAGTTEVTGTIKIPGGARIIKIFAMSVTGTGHPHIFRLDFPGIVSPQKYLLPVHNALEGTEVGAGGNEGRYLDVDIPVKGNVSEVTVGLTATAATQTCIAGIIWVA